VFVLLVQLSELDTLLYIVTEAMQSYILRINSANSEGLEDTWSYSLFNDAILGCLKSRRKGQD